MGFKRGLGEIDHFLTVGIWSQPTSLLARHPVGGKPRWERVLRFVLKAIENRMGRVGRI
jgi:hypothetical protein